MHLVLYLKRAGACTGPLSKNTSHSAIERDKKTLFGEPGFTGGEAFLIFGNALHTMWLIASTTIYDTLNSVEKLKIKAMLKALATNLVAVRLLANAVCEVKKEAKLNTVAVTYILDIYHRIGAIGADLKTTACKTFEDFLAKAIEYGYFRQAITYMKAARLRQFYFIGIAKEKPYSVFILDVNQYPEELAYAENELDFFLYLRKHYGKLSLIKNRVAATLVPAGTNGKIERQGSIRQHQSIVGSVQSSTKGNGQGNEGAKQSGRPIRKGR